MFFNAKDEEYIDVENLKFYTRKLEGDRTKGMLVKKKGNIFHLSYEKDWPVETTNIPFELL